MSQEKFWVLLSKKLSAEASETELKELEVLILEHPEWQYAIQNLNDLWKHPSPAKDYTQEEDAYMLHLHRMTELHIPFEEGAADIIPIQKNNNKRRWYWAAASLLVLLTAGFFLYNNTNSNAAEQDAVAKENVISTRPGSKSKVQLPDGTTVILNAGSKLTYTKDYGKSIREVHLTGEGFFDVQKMKETPFIIHTSTINIKVLGTVFNVKAYPEDKKTETSLIHGSIEVTIKNRPNDKIILSPSEKLVVENSVVTSKTHEKNSSLPDNSVGPVMALNKLTYAPADSAVAEMQWINNKLVFVDESLEELVVRMERWYDVSIRIDDTKLQARRVTGTFHNETIEQALEALKILIPFHYERKGSEIIIHR